MKNISRWLLFMYCMCAPNVLHASEGLDPAAFLEYPEVRNYVEYFTTGEKKIWLESALARGEMYNRYISDRIDEFSLPETLKYLPVIESGCNPRAVSPSGAAGLWQFMLNSIDPYDLLVNEWIDERKDFWKSTVAGLKKLAYNNAVLGDWLLAVAAYNCGLNRLKKAIEESNCRNFWELAEGDYLPEETKRYIPKLLAVAHIVENADRYDITLPAAAQWEWRRIPVTDQINLRLLVEHASIPGDLIAFWNAELRSDVTPPAEYAYNLKVPAVYSDVIDRFIQGETHIVGRFLVHTITPGDTLFALSRAYGVSVDRILQNNPGVHPRFLQINTKLIIPAPEIFFREPQPAVTPRPEDNVGVRPHTVPEGGKIPLQ